MPYRLEADGQSNHEIFFCQHAEQLKALPCHVLYTVPISLVFNRNLGDSFTDTEIIPMVRPDAAGKAALFDIVARRVDVERVFENPVAVEPLVKISGGSVRDLLRAVRFACDEADECISRADAERAVQVLVREYDYLVRDDDLDHLVRIARERHVSGDEASGRMLHHRLVLEYYDDNAERWADLHPAVRQVGRVQARLIAEGLDGHPC